MDIKNLEDSLWVVISLQNRLFGVSADRVQSMVEMPEIVHVPDAPAYARGVINLRGRVIPLVDLRMRLGMPTLINEMNDLLTRREQDHRNWLNELEASVREKRQFKLATDPHKCAFGKWYDSYKANNLIIASLLKKFDSPHKAIHAIAEKTHALSSTGNYKAANELIEKTRNNELSDMVRLFAELKRIFSEETREIAVVIEAKPQNFAVAVDSIESVGRINEGSFEDADKVALESLDRTLVEGIARYSKEDRLIMLLKPDRIIE